MILHAEGGTDGAMMGLFWPAYLPKEPSAELQDDPVGLIEDLDRQGRLISLPCDSDGGYRISVYLDEDPQAETMVRYKKERTYPEVIVDGMTFYGGLEYIFEHNVEAEGENYIGLCEILEVPEGSYELNVFIPKWPNKLVEAELEKRLGSSRWLITLGNSLIGLGCLSGLIIILGLFVLSAALSGWALMVGVLLFIFVWICRKAPFLQEVDRMREEIEKEFPHYLVTMRRKD